MQRSKYSAKWVLLVAMMVFGIVSSFAITQDDLLNRKISLNVEDGSIAHTLSTMARLSDCNIVLSLDALGGKDDQEDRRITIHLNDVPIEQALALVVKTVGLSYRLIGENTFLVGEKNQIEEEVGERSYVIPVNYIDVDKLTKALEVMPGEVTGVEGQNALLVRANPETYAEIANRIAELDVPQKQIEIRARIIEVSLTDTKQYGIDWSNLNHFTLIMAENPVNSSGVGLPYNFSDETGASIYGDATDFEVLPDQQYFMKMDDWDDHFHFSRQLTAFDITLDFLLENNAAKLLTDTRVTALNGEKADILIGEVLKYVSVDREGEYQTEEEGVGIKLEVLPKVNRDGLITTTISPEVSSIIELVDGRLPRKKTRQVNSTVTVPDGSKIIVGGLLSSTLSTTVNKLPFLGDIPFIGKLFQHKVQELKTTDLIIEITPRIVNLQNEQDDYEVDERLTQRLIKTKTDSEEE